MACPAEVSREFAMMACVAKSLLTERASSPESSMATSVEIYEYGSPSCHFERDDGGPKWGRIQIMRPEQDLGIECPFGFALK